jgi:hypothetical protein
MNKRFFCYDLEEGMSLHETLEDAKKEAFTILSEYQDNASHYEWNSDVEGLCYGECKGGITLKSSKPAPEDSPFDTIVEYCFANTVTGEEVDSD